MAVGEGGGSQLATPPCVALSLADPHPRCLFLVFFARPIIFLRSFATIFYQVLGEWGV